MVKSNLAVALTGIPKGALFFVVLESLKLNLFFANFYRLLWGVRGGVREHEGDPECGIPANCVRRQTVYSLPLESFLLTLPLPADNQVTLGPKLTTYALPHTP